MLGESYRLRNLEERGILSYQNFYLQLRPYLISKILLMILSRKCRIYTGYITERRRQFKVLKPREQKVRTSEEFGKHGTLNVMST